jgi:hypothetical protein
MFGRILLLATVLCTVACAVPPAPIPRTEFLVATPDSAFWVKTDAQGIRVRAVPMTLARYGGRFHEVYVANVNRSYNDAVFTGERLFVRDLVTSDSTMVYEDTAVARLSARYAKANPDAIPLGPTDNDPDNPSVSVTGETDILDVLGPYVFFEHRSSIQHGDDAQDDTIRSAIDLRTGRPLVAEAHARDSIASDSTTIHTLPHLWHRAGYDLLVRGNAQTDTLSFLLRDPLQRVWHVMTIQGPPRLYWLDAPPIDRKTRRALLSAFDGAAMYDETLKYVHYIPSRRTVLARYASFRHSP